MTTDTRKIETAVNAELEEHKRECMEIMELKFVKKNPTLNYSVMIGILGIVSACLAYYYSSESTQNEKQSMSGMRLDQIQKDVCTITERQDKIDKQVLEGQALILNEIKTLRRQR